MIKKIVNILSISFLSLLLVACGEKRVALFDDLSVRDANEVVATLIDQGIDAKKITEKKGISVQINEKDMARSVAILKEKGLPNRSQTSIGEIFKKEGVISTPLEERARYIYALSQELEFTLSQIDDIMVARVHVVLPERVAPGQPISPSSAAVFIKHLPDLDPDVIEPRIRRLVTSSIPGLSQAKTDKISISFIESNVKRSCTELRKVNSFIGSFVVAEEYAVPLSKTIKYGFVLQFITIIFLVIFSNSKLRTFFLDLILRVLKRKNG